MNVWLNGINNPFGMKLFCIKGEGEPDAIFIRASDGELIRASGCVWRDGSVEWRSGSYCGHISKNLWDSE